MIAFETTCSLVVLAFGAPAGPIAHHRIEEPFDGKDDFVAIPAGETAGRRAFTFALWVKTEQRASAPRAEFWKNPTLLGVATTTPGSRDLGIILEDGRAAYHHGLADGMDTRFFSGAMIADGCRHLIVLACDGIRVALFVDGRIVPGEVVAGAGDGIAAGAARWTPAGAPLVVAPFFAGGCNDTSLPGEAEHFFRGAIDDLRIWDRALLAKEIASLWTDETGEAIPPEPVPPQAADAGPPEATEIIAGGGGLRWTFERRDGTWRLGTIALHGREIEGPVRSGLFRLRRIGTGRTVPLAARILERIDERTARLGGREEVDGAGIAFEVTCSVSADLPAATLDVRWEVDRDLAGWEVAIAWHEGFRHSWYGHLYPFAENARSIRRAPLTYVGVPAVLLAKEDLSHAVLFGIDVASDYLNPTTWTGTTSFDFVDGVVPAQFRACGGTLERGVKYHLPLQLFATDAGEASRAISDLVRAWIALDRFRIAPLSVRTPDEALDLYLRGRRSTPAWREGKGYILQPGAWDAIYLGTTPASAYFEYRIFERTGDPLWRERAFSQMDFTLKAQDRDPKSIHAGAIHTAYDLGKGEFDSADRGNNIGYKPDLIAHMARYMLLVWERLKAHEGIDRRDWYEAAVRAADWVVRQRNEDGGLPQKVDIRTGERSNSVASGRALPAMPIIARITKDAKYLECAATMEAFVRRSVEGRWWFTGAHPDLPPNDYESDSIWGLIEYWLDEGERTGEKECLERAIADAYLSLLWWCPKQLSWVESPTVCAHAEQQHYLQYSLYCYHNRKIQCLSRLADATGDPLFRALCERVLQSVFWTQETEGENRGAMYERTSDPWRARGSAFDSRGTLYLNELSLDAMVQLIDMGIAAPRP
ncbi:MAG: hypothetical protein JXP34_21585 [Planctomycetes bacterium]|nr:hypothetical protein [Planctomycetota bacterium]